MALMAIISSSGEITHSSTSSGLGSRRSGRNMAPQIAKGTHNSPIVAHSAQRLNCIRGRAGGSGACSGGSTG
jgi:hypothetical protein